MNQNIYVCKYMYMYICMYLDNNRNISTYTSRKGLGLGIVEAWISEQASPFAAEGSQEVL